MAEAPISRSNFPARQLLARITVAAVLLAVVALLRNAVFPPPPRSLLGDEPLELGLYVFVGAIIWGFVIAFILRIAGRASASFVGFSGSWVLLHIGDLPTTGFGSSLARLLLVAMTVALATTIISEIVIRIWPRRGKSAA